MTDRPGPRDDDAAPDASDALVQLRRDLHRVRGRVLDLRIAVMRICTATPLILLALGSALPLWTGTDDDEEPITVRLVSVPVLALRALSSGDGSSGDGGTEPESWLLLIGLVGLLLTTLVLAWALASSVIGRVGRSRFSAVRVAAGALTAIGAVIVCSLSVTAAGSRDADESGGWGGLFLLAGAIAGLATVVHSGWHDLWVDQDDSVPRTSH